MRVYVSVPERGVPAPQGALEAILEALEQGGHEGVNEPSGRATKSVLPQHDRHAFVLACDQMLEADILVADVSGASLGVGWTLSWFLARGRLAVVCCQREARVDLSGLVAGNPSPWQRLVVYDGSEDLRAKLLDVLRR